MHHVCPSVPIFLGEKGRFSVGKEEGISGRVGLWRPSYRIWKEVIDREGCEQVDMMTNWRPAEMDLCAIENSHPL